MISRRAIIGGGVTFALLPTWAWNAAAQTSKVPRIGVLGPADANIPWLAQGLREGLHELGLIEGRNIRVEYRWAHGHFDRLPALAAELVRLEVDVIVSVLTAASLAAKAATGTIPIVMLGVADPVSVGLVPSIARPGGNVTGTSLMSAAIVGKQLELAKDADPNLSRMAVLWNPANPVFQTLQVRAAEAAGRASGVQLLLLEASGPDEFDAAFAAMRQAGIRTLLILGDPMFGLHRERLAGHIAKDRLIVTTGISDFAEAGALMTYTPSYRHATRRALAYADRILKGANPADLPIEQPTTFDLVVNLKTAKALGLTIPNTVLVRADEVIE
jgi:putative tryptophan/tyrosine transport system substrate-binding protein